MRKTAESVPFGYEPPEEEGKGTLVYYDSFELTTDGELSKAAATTRERAFAKLVLYPLHEQTIKRMFKLPSTPYYKREKRLVEWIGEQGAGAASLDGWEGKRKKYTPIEAALRHLTETLPPPLFLYVTPRTADAFASFATFEEWITRIRLILSAEPSSLHPRLAQYRDRWQVAK